MRGKPNVCSGLVFLAVVLMARPIDASLLAPSISANAYVDATYPGYFDNNFHGDYGSGQYPSSASILWQGVGNVSQSAMAEVNQGYFRSSVDVEGEGTTLQVGYGHSWAVTSLIDTLTVNGYTLILPLHLDGSVSISYAVANPVSGIPGFVRLRMGCNASTDTSTQTNSCVLFGASPSLSYTWTSSTTVNVDLDFVIGTTPGVPFDFYWDTVLEADLGLPPGTGTFAGDFSHTGLFGPAEVLDQNGNIISNPQITSANGYNYLDPSGPASESTPEPGTIATLGAGLLGVTWATRRNRSERRPSTSSRTLDGRAKG